MSSSKLQPDKITRIIRGKKIVVRCQLWDQKLYMKRILDPFCRLHDDVIKWKHFPRYRSIERGIHRSPVNFPNKGQWRRALMFSLISVWTNGWLNTRNDGDLRRHPAHYDVTVFWWSVRMPLATQMLHTGFCYQWKWISKVCVLQCRNMM